MAACKKKCPTCHWVKCICNPLESYETFDMNMEIYEKDCQKHFDIISEPLRISTTTLCFKVKHVTFDLGKFCKHYENSKNKLVQEIKYAKVSKKSKDSAVNDHMYNTLTIVGEYENPQCNVTAKIFRNGSFNITGLKTMKQITQYIKDLMQLFYNCDDDVFIFPNIREFVNAKNLFIKLIKGGEEIKYEFAKRVRIDHRYDEKKKLFFPTRIEIKQDDSLTSHNNIYIENISLYICETYDEKNSVKLPSKYHIHPFNVKIAMINSVFKLKRKLILPNVVELYSSECFSVFKNQHGGGRIVSHKYNPDARNCMVSLIYLPRSRSLEKTTMTRKRTMKYVGEITIQMYNTGSVMITAGIHTSDIIEAYYYIINSVSEHQHFLYRKE